MRLVGARATDARRDPVPVSSGREARSVRPSGRPPGVCAALGGLIVPKSGLVSVRSHRNRGEHTTSCGFVRLVRPADTIDRRSGRPCDGWRGEDAGDAGATIDPGPKKVYQTPPPIPPDTPLIPPPLARAKTPTPFSARVVAPKNLRWNFPGNRFPRRARENWRRMRDLKLDVAACGVVICAVEESRKR